MESKKLNILIVGVGGQGTLLASKFIGMAARLAGRDVKVSEVHGMSQRGGSVVTCVKMGDEVFSPVIDLGEADVMLSFEQVEAVRWLPYLKKGGTVITSEQ
ncbi:MAG: indolepyruvate oxidoreductase subunit beta, partial [Clostridia bacterium]|nr:indolepyruvate oxidoreductase subunit beta [Clostridia bacterium]